MTLWCIGEFGLNVSADLSPNMTLARCMHYLNTEYEKKHRDEPPILEWLYCPNRDLKFKDKEKDYSNTKQTTTIASDDDKNLNKWSNVTVGCNKIYRWEREENKKGKLIKKEVKNVTHCTCGTPLWNERGRQMKVKKQNIQKKQRGT